MSYLINLFYETDSKSMSGKQYHTSVTVYISMNFDIRLHIYPVLVFQITGADNDDDDEVKIVAVTASTETTATPNPTFSPTPTTPLQTCSPAPTTSYEVI